MKKICYIGEEKFIFGINEIKKQLNFDLDNSGIKIICKKTGVGIAIKVDSDCVVFTYGKDNEFFRGFALAVEHAGQVGKNISVELLFDEFGTMLECSSGVDSVQGVKEFIRQSALMGYTYLGLYTETTYEIENEPYFGYKIGKYSIKELQEIVSYGEKFFIEIIPYIQTLGHMASLFQWSEYAHLKDINDTLLVEYDKTYELIEKMLISLRKAYKTNRINLGMDEAYFMGFGRYNWFINDSLPNRETLFVEHVKKVVSLAEKYGFTLPEIWHDNIFDIKFKGYLVPPAEIWKPFDELVRQNFPKIKLRFWYYGLNNEADYDRYFSYLKTLSSDVGFANAIFGWGSFCPNNYKTEEIASTMQKACLSNGVKDVLITIWSVRYAVCSMLAGIMYYVETCSKSSGYDINEHAKFLFGYTYQELLLLDIPDKLKFEGVEQPNGNPSYYILADDPLLGVMEKHIPSNAESYYSDCAKKLDELSNRDSQFAYLYRFESVLCQTLAKKALLSTNIKRSYDEKDKETMLKIVNSIPEIIAQVKVFHAEYREYWLKVNKVIDFKIFDMRLGGVVARLEYAQEIITKWINGKIDKIEELEEDRLPISKNSVGKIADCGLWNQIALGGLDRL